MAATQRISVKLKTLSRQSQENRIPKVDKLPEESDVASMKTEEISSPDLIFTP
jgi:hypothetical protein